MTACAHACHEPHHRARFPPRRVTSYQSRRSAQGRLRAERSRQQRPQIFTVVERYGIKRRFDTVAGRNRMGRHRHKTHAGVGQRSHLRIELDIGRMAVVAATLAAVLRPGLGRTAAVVAALGNGTARVTAMLHDAAAGQSDHMAAHRHRKVDDKKHRCIYPHRRTPHKHLRHAVVTTRRVCTPSGGRSTHGHRARQRPHRPHSCRSARARRPTGRNPCPEARSTAAARCR